MQSVNQGTEEGKERTLFDTVAKGAVRGKWGGRDLGTFASGFDLHQRERTCQARKRRRATSSE